MAISWERVFLFLVIVGAGFFGGVVSFLLDFMYGERVKGGDCRDCRVRVVFCRGFIGVGGATAIVFLALWVDKLKLFLETTNLFILIGLCSLSGTASFRMLPKLGRKLEEQVLRDEFKKSQEDAKKEVIDISKQQSDKSIEYSSIMTLAREALEVPTNQDQLNQAIESLSRIAPKFPTDRPLNIYLGRLHRWAGNIDDAILALRRFIENIDRFSGGAPDKCLLDKSAALYNIACYHAVKAKKMQEDGGPSAEVQRISGEALTDLAASLDIWSKRANIAMEDPDFNFLKNSRDYAERFNSLIRGHQGPQPRG